MTDHKEETKNMKNENSQVDFASVHSDEEESPLTLRNKNDDSIIESKFGKNEDSKDSSIVDLPGPYQI